MASATNAIDAATALNGGVNTVAAQFTFGGRTYLAINLANNGFLDADDLLLDITGATGAISGSNFILRRICPRFIGENAAGPCPGGVFSSARRDPDEACSFQRRYGRLPVNRRMNGCSFGRRQLHEKQGRKPPE